MLDIDIKLARGDFDLQMKFAVPGGNVIALFGASGCGKTTTANLIAGLITPDSGRIVLGDRVVFDSANRINIPAEQRGIGYVFQNARLFPHLNVNQNLVYGLRRTRNQRFIDVDFVVNLLDLQALLQRHPVQLSGGEQQRVAMGRALLSQPSLLILDEPLSSLDVARRNEVLPYLERLRDSLKITMLYISHQFEEVLRLATQVILMNKGNCLALGPLHQLSLQPELHQMLGTDGMGTVVETHVTSIDTETGLAQLAIGNGTISINASSLEIRQRVRVQLLARDLILSLDTPLRLSIRNKLQGVVTNIQFNRDHTALVYIDVGGITLMSQVTQSAVSELDITPGKQVWVLVKAMTLRGHVFMSPALESRS